MQCVATGCIPLQMGLTEYTRNLLAASAKPSRTRGATPSAAPAHSACGKIGKREGMPVSAVARS